VCGSVSGGFTVLDFDKINGWWNTFNSWVERTYGKTVYELTPVVKTSRGYQVYLRVSQPEKKRRYPGGLDIQGEKSYVVAPPSIHPDGPMYRFENPDVLSILQVGSLEEIGITSTEKKALHIDTQQDEVRLIGELISPHWQQGNRHDLSLSISAFLAKIGWPLPMVEDVIKSVSGNDSELGDRLRAVRDTYSRVKSNQPTRGYKGLEETLPLTTLQRLEALAKSARIPPLVRKIDDIRLCDDKPFLKNRHIADAVRESLTETGTFLRTPGNELYYFEGSTIALDSPEFKALIEKRFGLNPTEVEGRYVLSNLENETLSQGKKIDVYRLAYWDRSAGILFIHTGNGEVLKLNGSTIDCVKNGDSGVYFASEGWQQPFKPDLNSVLSPWQYLTDDLSFELGELVALTPQQQTEVAKFWVLSLFFTEELPTKPLLCLTGDAGSGKSLFLRRLVRFLYGSGDLDTVRDKDDLWASLASGHLLVLDDIESGQMPKWLGPELKRAATGQTITLRKLYTTNSKASFTPRCFVAFTSINPPIGDGAIAERMVILRLKKRDSQTPESRLLRTVGDNRNKLWGGLLHELNKCIPKVRTQASDTTFRMADWASLVERIAGQERTKPILRGLTSFQDEALLADSPLPAIIDEWKEQREEWLAPAQLHSIWANLASGRGLHYPFRSTQGLSNHLASVRGNLARVFGLEWQKTTGRGKSIVYHFRS